MIHPGKFAIKKTFDKENFGRMDKCSQKVADDCMGNNLDGFSLANHM